MWSRTDPATLFGAAVTGWADVRAAFEWPGRRSHCTSCPNEISAAGASGDLAHTVTLEHTTASVNSTPPQPKPVRQQIPAPLP
jgi:hypothetical protein